MADEPSKDDLAKILRETVPPWLQDGGGIRGLNPRRIGGPPPAEVPGGRFQVQVKQSLETPPFPADDTTQQTTEETDEQVDQSNEYGFELEVDSIDKDAGTVDIHVGYGEMRDVLTDDSAPPTGMTGADDYLLTISADGTEIWGVITYDPDTLLWTSRSLAFGAIVPASTLGTIIVPIGFIDISFDGGGKIKEVTPHNRQCGDIQIALTYGTMNGAEALTPYFAYSNPVAIT